MSAQSAPEQSMEDILASIRKIISDDGIEEAVADAQSSAASSEEAYVQANDETGAPAPSISVESPIPAVLVERRESLEDSVGQNLHPAIANAMAFVATGEGQQSPAAEKPVFAGNANDTPQISERSLVSPDDSDRRGEDERRNHPLRRGADRGDQEFKTALMSPSTNNAITSSFEQLKASATDDLDDKVEAMLRPMLREWMDNNLPSMVERLVRDEIERVSRGE